MPFIPMKCAANGCENQISPLGGFVKTKGHHYHLECYLGPLERAFYAEGREELRPELEQMATNLRTAIAKNAQLEQLAAKNMFGPDPTSTPRYAPGEQPKFSKEPKGPEVPLTLEEWDKVADKTISRFTVNHGAMLPQVALKLYLKRLYRDFIEARLAIPLTDDTEALKPQDGKPGPTLDQWMKGNK